MKPHEKRRVIYVATAIVLLGGGVLLRDTEWQGSTSLHTLMELAATLLASFVGAMALVRFFSRRDALFLYIGTGFLGTAMLDGYHAVVTSIYFQAYMPSDNPHLVPWSWIASRLFLSVLMFVSWLLWFKHRNDVSFRPNTKIVMIGTAVATLSSFLFFAAVPLPAITIEGARISRPAELLPAIFFLMALVGYLYKGGWREDQFEHWLVLSLIVGVATQTVFMPFSEHLYDTEFNLAHLLKKLSYILVLTGLLSSLYQAYKDLQAEAKKRKEGEIALRESHEQLHSLLDSMAEGAYGVDTKGNCTFVNRAFLHILGYEHAEELIGKHIHELIHHSHPDGSPYPESECTIYCAYRSIQPINASNEVFWRKDGSSLPVEYWSNPIVVDGVVAGAIATFIDITERKLAEDQISNLAFYDTLTQLPNRRLLNDRLCQAIFASRRSDQYGALMFLDLDNFKPVNDLHGHNVGDLLLIEAARRISSCVRKTDTVARFGGDEFVVMLNELHEDQAESTARVGIVAEKIRATLAEPYLLRVSQDGKAESTVEHHCTSSIGVVVFNQQANQEDILRWADMAMYAAKNGGRNRVVINQQGRSDARAVNLEATILHLNWHESYGCGESIIDQEHRKLFELANVLIESAFARNENPQGFDEALDKLLAHVVQHFADEEAILARYHFSDLDAHSCAHKKLIEHALRLRDEAAAGGVTIGELVNFIAQEVVAQHMLKIDRKYYPLFKRAQSSS